jgi:hypothetical protein
MLFLVLFLHSLWTSDVLLILVLLWMLVSGKERKFYHDFAPFIVMMLAYGSLRIIAETLSRRVHVMTMIDFDRWLGGGVLPTVWLQDHLYHGHLHWYDYYFYLLYLAHFLFPVLLGVLIWVKRRAEYTRYISALVALTFLGFITYIVYPAAPPWLAAEQGVIPPIQKLATDIWFSLGIHNFPAIYHNLNPNLVAAVPSLHAAYPVLFWLFVHRLFGWKYSLPFLIYPLSVWLGIVYMGEHYVFDVLLGGVYAVAVYSLTMRYFDLYIEPTRSYWGRLRKRLVRKKSKKLLQAN